MTNPLDSLIRAFKMLGGAEEDLARYTEPCPQTQTDDEFLRAMGIRWDTENV